MSKMQYPIFYIWGVNKNNFVAVFDSTNALEIAPANSTNGFTFYRYYSRAKVIKLERAAYDFVSAEEFYLKAGAYMQAHLNKVKEATLKALPEFGSKLLN